MLYFFEQFMKKIYIPAWVFLGIWLILKIMSIFDRILWVQGLTRISIDTIVLILFVLCLLIAHTIVKTEEAINYHWLVLPFSMLVFLIGFSIILYNNPITRDYYTEGDYSVIVVTDIISSNSDVSYFYQQEGILAKRVAYCIEDEDSVCSYEITNGDLIVDRTVDGKIKDRYLVPLD